MNLQRKEQKAKSKKTGTAFYFAAMIVALLITGCSSKENVEKRVITVSILPQKYWVERIAGDRFDVQVMVPPGIDSHTYEPTPKDMKKLSESPLYFSLEYIDFERSYLSKFASVHPGMKMIGLPDDVTLIEGDAEHGGVDPHFWLSVAEVRKIVAGMLEPIIQLDPGHAGLYRENYERFVQDMDMLEVFLQQVLAPGRGRSVIIYHPTLAYLARDYGFTQISLEEGGKNPSVAHMKEIIDLARQKDLRTILIQQQIDQTMAQGVADEIGGQVEALDPLAYDWLENMRKIARILNRIFQS